MPELIEVHKRGKQYSFTTSDGGSYETGPDGRGLFSRRGKKVKKVAGSDGVFTTGNKKAVVTFLRVLVALAIVGGLLVVGYLL